MIPIAKESNNLNKSGRIASFCNFIRKLSTAGQNDIQVESDAQMLARVGKKFAVLFFVILMFDELLDLLFGFFQAVFDLIHLFGEVIEYVLEIVLKYALYTDHHQSETIIVNTAIIISLYGLYRLFCGAHGLYLRFKRNLPAVWLKRKRRASSSWQALSLGRRIKLATAYAFGSVCLLFLLTL